MIDNPHEIEKKSFEIIIDELKEKGIAIEEEFLPTVVRVVHTTADFDYAEITEIHPEAVARAINALKTGCRIYSDTKMIQTGINSKKLKECGAEIYTYISDEDVAREAGEKGITRSIVGMEKACKDPDTKIFVIGNAPTALMTLKKKIKSGSVKPELVVGVPVGFVGAAESKEDIKEAGVPYIVTNGRKGGSTVAVAIINSILYQIK